ncbi:MAG: ComF family protein [Acidaminococcaceae bacterium]|nr:ComF family protein [Acidaminococcaceae bacterium]
MFPRCCAGCGVEIEAGFLCLECRKGLLQMKDFPPVEELAGGVFFFAYENRVKEAIHQIKFCGDKNMSVLLSEETDNLFKDLKVHKTITKFLTDAGKSHPFAEKDFTEKSKIRGKIIQTFIQKEGRGGKRESWLWSGIPTDPGRLRQRGFDLPTVLFSERAKYFGGIWKQTLCRTRKTLPMYGLSAEERRRNLQDCFAVTGNVRGKSIVLVDDIFTTGATFSAAAAVLKEAGAETVKGLAFCGSIENLR